MLKHVTPNKKNTYWLYEIKFHKTGTWICAEEENIGCDVKSSSHEILRVNSKAEAAERKSIVLSLLVFYTIRWICMYFETFIKIYHKDCLLSSNSH